VLVTETAKALAAVVDDSVAVTTPENDSGPVNEAPTTEVISPELEITNSSAPVEFWRTKKSPVCEAALVIVRISVAAV